jgi:hypothetical protein
VFTHRHDRHQTTVNKAVARAGVVIVTLLLLCCYYYCYVIVIIVVFLFLLLCYVSNNYLYSCPIETRTFLHQSKTRSEFKEPSSRGENAIIFSEAWKWESGSQPESLDSATLITMITTTILATTIMISTTIMITTTIINIIDSVAEEAGEADSLLAG